MAEIETTRGKTRHERLRAALLRGETLFEGMRLPTIEDDPAYWETFAPNYTQRPRREYDERDAATRDEIRFLAADQMAFELLDAERAVGAVGEE